MYEYKGTVKHVVDGDTVDISVSLGFSISVDHRFRVKDVDTPEIYRPKTALELDLGRKASAFAKHVLLGREVRVRTYKLGIYGRYVADIYVVYGGVERLYADLLRERGLIKSEVGHVPKRIFLAGF